MVVWWLAFFILVVLALSTTKLSIFFFVFSITTKSKQRVWPGYSSMAPDLTSKFFRGPCWLSYCFDFFLWTTLFVIAASFLFVRLWLYLCETCVQKIVMCIQQISSPFPCSSLWQTTAAIVNNCCRSKAF